MPEKAKVVRDTAVSFDTWIQSLQCQTCTQDSSDLLLDETGSIASENANQTVSLFGRAMFREIRCAIAWYVLNPSVALWFELLLVVWIIGSRF